MVAFLFLCVVSTWAGEPELSPNVADALESIWGVRDIPSLFRIAENPQVFWHERAKELLEGPTRAITHLEFCEQYTADAKVYIAQKLADRVDAPWFKDPEAIDEVIKHYISADHPAFFPVRFNFYTFACDYIRDLYGPLPTQRTVCGPPLSPDSIKNIQDKSRKMREFRQMCFESKANFHVSLSVAKKEDFSSFCWESQDMLRWKVVPGGKFCFVDSLILLSKDLYLCSVSTDFEERANSYEHNGQFTGWYGPYDHDALSHVGLLELISEDIGKHGVDYKKYVKDCCNPKDLVAGNLIALSLQMQAWFNQFHELPSAEGTFSKDDVFSMLFPRVSALIDPGFMLIVPYFLNPPPNDDWATLTPLRSCSYDTANAYLMSWCRQYCYKGVWLLDEKGMGRYLRELEEDIACLKQADFDRFPPFVQGVLERLYALNAKDDATSDAYKRGYTSFAEEAQSCAQRAIIALQTLAREGRNVKLFVPYAVHFLMLTRYADKLFAARSRVDVCFDERSWDSCRLVGDGKTLVI